MNPLIDQARRFDDPHDERQLQALDAALEAAPPFPHDRATFDALLGLFERFPEDDGYGVFWGVLHTLEDNPGYPSALCESVLRAPAEFSLLMLKRLLNGGIAHADGHDLLRVLAHAAQNPAAPAAVRASARDLLDHQRDWGMPPGETADDH